MRYGYPINVWNGEVFRRKQSRILSGVDRSERGRRAVGHAGRRGGSLGAHSLASSRFDVLTRLRRVFSAAASLASRRFSFAALPPLLVPVLCVFCVISCFSMRVFGVASAGWGGSYSEFVQ